AAPARAVTLPPAAPPTGPRAEGPTPSSPANATALLRPAAPAAATPTLRTTLLPAESQVARAPGFPAASQPQAQGSTGERAGPEPEPAGGTAALGGTGGSAAPVFAPVAPVAEVTQVAQVDGAVAALEAANRIDPALLARLLAPLVDAHPAAWQAPHLIALQQLHRGLTVGAQAIAERRWLDALRELRPALDAWPQYPMLHEHWRTALDQGLAPALAALAAVPDRVGEPGDRGGLAATADPTLAGTFAGLVDLLAAPDDSNRRWLGAWLPRLHTALHTYCAAATRPEQPLAARRAWQAACGAAFARFDPAAAAAFAAHLALTHQRRLDLATALANGRAQVAMGKALALWTAGESTRGEDPAAGDLGERALRLWRDQTSAAIVAMQAPPDAASLAEWFNRLLGPLHAVLALIRAAAAPPPFSSPPAADLVIEQATAAAATVTSLAPPPSPPSPPDLPDQTHSVSAPNHRPATVTLDAGPVRAALVAIESDLYLRLLALARRPEDAERWQAAWRELPFQPLSPRWIGLAEPAAARAVHDLLTARLALAQYRLEDAWRALTGAAEFEAADATGPVRLDRARFAAVGGAAALDDLIARWQEQW
ncbi:MAG: hypothetical protein ACREJ2_06335, partial [Planctomycetota bacterium]